jgi:hypothetical protein
MKKFGMLFLGILMAFGTANATTIDFSLPGTGYTQYSSPYAFEGLTITSNYTLTRYADGLGVKGPWYGIGGDGQDNTEIDSFYLTSDERVMIAGTNIQGFTASRLFAGETGLYSYNGSTWYQFAGDSDGFVSVVLNPTSTLYLKAYDGCDYSSDFSVKNVSVPEPATMLLLGLGLFTLAGIKRKMK